MLTSSEVITGFIAIGYLALFIIIMYYFFGYNPELDPYRKSDEPILKIDRPNPVDQLMFRWIRQGGQHRISSSTELSRDGKILEVFNKVRTSGKHDG